MTNILTIDTCLGSCSVAIHKDDNLCAETFLDVGLNHSCVLAPVVDNLLKCVGIESEDIDVFGVTNGPGSFTGIRIGVAMAKGMAFAYDTCCVAVSSLFALALNKKDFKGLICSCIDARNNQIYNAIFSGGENELKIVKNDRSILIDELVNELKEESREIVFVGDAGKICYNAMKDVKTRGNLIFDEKDKYVKASNVGLEVFRRYRNGLRYSHDEILAKYIKVSQAERELEKRLRAKGDAKI